MTEWRVGDEVEVWLDGQWHRGQIMTSGANRLGMSALPPGTVRVLIDDGWTVTHDVTDSEVADCLRRPWP